MTTVKNLIKYTALAALAVGFVSCGDDDDDNGDETNLPEIEEVTAAFTSAAVEGEDYTIQFTNTSENGATYSWDFNADGTEDSTEESPKYTFAAAGEYTVALTATNEAGDDDDAASSTVTVAEPPVTLPSGANLTTNGDFEDASGQAEHWFVNSVSDETLMRTYPFNGSSDGSGTTIDGTVTGVKTKGAKWTAGTSYKGVGTNTGETRFGYQELTLDANTEYVLAYEYSMKLENAAGSYLMAEIVAGHYADGLDALAAAQAGTLVSIKGDVINGKGHDLFITGINKFTTPADGKVFVWLHANVSADSYIDNVRVIKQD